MIIGQCEYSGSKVIIVSLLILSSSGCAAVGIASILHNSGHDVVAISDSTSVLPSMSLFDLLVLRVSPELGEADPFYQIACKLKPHRLLLLTTDSSLALKLRRIIMAKVSFVALPCFAEELADRVNEICNDAGCAQNLL